MFYFDLCFNPNPIIMMPTGSFFIQNFNHENYLFFLLFISIFYLYAKQISSARIQNRIVFNQNEVYSLLWSYSQIYGILEYSMLHSRVNMHRSTKMDIIDKNYSIQSQSNDHCQSNNQHVDQIRYVEYQFGIGGLANKIFGLVSSYVIAALLKATFICSIEAFFMM